MKAVHRENTEKRSIPLPDQHILGKKRPPKGGL